MSLSTTVFVRFTPPSKDVHRRHLEELFSDIGPIKKCSVIQQKNDDEAAPSYGFIKFLTEQDAQQAATVWNNKSFTVYEKKYTIKVQVASEQQQKSGKNAAKTTNSTTTTNTSTNDKIQQQPPPPTTTIDKEELLAKRKRTCRVLIRNLSFYAKEHHIKTTLEQEFGPILELHLPRINETTHRGFCFVTFEHPKDAHASTMPRKTPLMIQKRPVAIDYAVSKRIHQQEQLKKQTQHQKDDNNNNDDDSAESENEQKDDAEESDQNNDDEDNENDSKQDYDDDDEEESDNDDEDDENENENEQDDDHKSDTEKESRPTTPPIHDEGVAQHQTLFLRNLPFDTTRHDVFQLMHTFGHIESIFLVKDKETGVFKGTCFLKYKTPQAAARVMEQQQQSPFVSQKDGTTPSTAGLQLKGRALYCDYAVDKATASTLTLEHQEKVTGKDRRNMYLKTEGRVANLADLPGNVDNTAWESLPESDQLKRQRAFMEKNSKLKSPLFFINPKRLSIRNLAKHVDEAELKKLVVNATIKGLVLVSQDDQVAHWRASGDVTTRDVLKKLESAEPIIPALDEKNVKESIPSVYIDRDFTSKKSEVGQSRGFGFVDFTHHVHALACMRELNNNPKYSVEFVASGKKGNAKNKELMSGSGFGNNAPRLIVDFTVENSAKAKKQAEHRAQQQANREHQKADHKSKKKTTDEKKMSRGALQREKKRKAKDMPTLAVTSKAPTVSLPKPVVEREPKVKTVKPLKKQKLDNEEQTFERLVQSYTKSFSSSITNAEGADVVKPKKSEKRWFE